MFTKTNAKLCDGGEKHAENIPAQEAPEKQGSRIPQENEHCQRQKGSCQKTCKGQSQTYSLSSNQAMKTAVLRDNRDFQRLYHRGKKCVSGMFAVYYRQNGIPQTRIGITAGKKLGCAVERNRIRRQIREIIRLSPEALSPGYDIVIVARSRAIGKAWRDQQEDLLGLLKSGGLFCRTV